MGLIRFAVFPVAQLNNWPEVFAGYLTGADGRVFPTRIEVVGNIIECRRSTSESVKFHVGWPVRELGVVIVPTSSLSEREQPYLLPVELARGKIVQVRNQYAQWELSGMKIPEDFVVHHRAAQRAFSKAACSQDQPEAACVLANEAIHQAFIAGEILTRAYAAQSFAGRLQRFGTVAFSIGCELHQALPTPQTQDIFSDLFNAATVSMPWNEIETVEGEYNWESTDKQLEWCESQRMMVRGGPLLDLGAENLPLWLSPWKDDFHNLQSFVCDFVETAISRYVGRIRVWEICTRMNTGTALGLNEEHRLTLTARALDVARQVDEEAQLILRIDQPWGEYQSQGQHRLAPLQTVDALIRSGVGLSGVNLELAMGFTQLGMARRDLLECSRLIDMWSLLDIPIYIRLICPSSLSEDRNSSPEHQANLRAWARPIDENSQAEWIDQLLDLFVAKPRVAGVFLPHFSDGSIHVYPNSGVLRMDDVPKPVSDRIKARQNHRRKS